jgi:hypothetical protein
MGLMELLKLQFILSNEYFLSISDFESMMVWERIVYADMLKANIEEKNMKIREENARRNNRR